MCPWQNSSRGRLHRNKSSYVLNRQCLQCITCIDIPNNIFCTRYVKFTLQMFVSNAVPTIPKSSVT